MDFFEKAQARAHALNVLGLVGQPDIRDIKAAYKKLAMVKHPDHAEGSAEEFAKIHEAYTLLKEDQGFTKSDQLRPAPEDMGNTDIRSTSEADGAERRVSPRRFRTGKTSRIMEINEHDAQECRSLLDEIPHMATPDADEVSLRSSIMNAIKETGAPHVPATNHLPYAIRQSGRRISYMVNTAVEEGVNRVAVPTGVFSDARKVLPTMVRFKSGKKGAGTHIVSATTLADSFPGAKSVRIHFGMSTWPESLAERKEAAMAD